MRRGARTRAGAAHGVGGFVQVQVVAALPARSPARRRAPPAAMHPEAPGGDDAPPPRAPGPGSALMRALEEQTQRAVADAGGPLGGGASGAGDAGEEGEGGGGGEHVSAIVDVVMQHLLSKDVLYAPMKARRAARGAAWGAGHGAGRRTGASLRAARSAAAGARPPPPARARRLETPPPCLKPRIPPH